MADKCGPDEVSTDNAKKAIEGAADLTEPDRDLSLRVLDLMNRSFENLPARLSDQPVCHSEQILLGRSKLDGVSPEGLNILDKLLVPGKDSKPSQTPKYIVYDKSNEHADVVRDVIKAKSGAKDSDIQVISPDLAFKLRKAFVKTPEEIDDPTDTERKMLHAADSQRELVAADLRKMLPEVEKNPGVVINISMSIFDVGLNGVGASTNENRLMNIGFGYRGLDMVGVKSVGEIDKKFLNDLEAHLRARTYTDIRAQNTIEIVDGLRALADAGAQIRLAWGNDDVVAINKLLAQVHPNIKAVAALDSKGKVADYNSNTAELTAERAPGTVLFMSKEQMDKIDRSKVSKFVTLLEAPSSLNDDLTGKELGVGRMSPADFQQLKKMQPVADYILNIEKTLSKVRVGFYGDLKESDLRELYDDLHEANPADTKKLLGERSEFLDKMSEIARADTTQMSDEKLREHLQRNKEIFDNVYKLGLADMAEDMSKVGLPPKDGQSPQQALEEFYKRFTDLAKTGVLSKSQLRELFKNDAAEFFKALGSRNAYLFKLNGPNLFDTQPDGYVTIPDKKGAKILSQEWIGTSFASPVAAAAARAKVEAEKKIKN